MTMREAFNYWATEARKEDHRMLEAFAAGWDAAGNCLELIPQSDDAAQIYAIYPKKVGRAAALKAITKALKVVPFYRLKERTQAYADAVARWSKDDRQYVPHPATWYNRGSYDDDPNEWKRGADATSQFGKTYN